MARNGTGIFRVLYPVLIGALRSSAKVDSNFTDMGTEITNTIPLDGTAGMGSGAQIKAAIGTAIGPGIAFDADTNTGFYRKAADMMAWVCGNTERLYNDAAGKFWANGNMDLAGTAAIPALTGAGVADLIVIEALSGTGLLRRTGSNAWSLDDGTYDIDYTFNLPVANLCFDIYMTHAVTITGVGLLSDVSGSAVVDIRKCTYSQFDAGSTHPVSGDSICASAKPTLSSAASYSDTTLTGWTTAVAAADVLRFFISSASTITRLTVTLKVKRYI